MDNDAARHELTETLALVQEHLADLAVVEKRLAALSATASAADGTVVVTVNAQGVVSDAAVGETCLDDYDLADLGEHITAAARAAARDVATQTAQLLAPLAERRAQFPSLADIVDGAPEIRDLLPRSYAVDQAPQFAGEGGRDGEETGHFPTVRS